jgi:hypothetical protein
MRLWTAAATYPVPADEATLADQDGLTRASMVASEDGRCSGGCRRSDCRTRSGHLARLC